jgi:hypothetical protein
MTKISTKIKLYANQEVNFNKDVLLQDDGQGVYIKKWNLDIAQPTQAQLDALETEAQTEENLQNILNARASAYPSIQEQLDMQYWDNVNGTTTWNDIITKIKTDNPKG